MNSSGSRPLNATLIGYGFAGKTFHAPVLMHVPGIRLTHIVSSNPAKVAKDCPAVTVLGSPEEAFRNPEIDLIVIATPNTSHAPLAAAALASGKHVVVDKPFTITAAEAAALLAQAEKAKLLISVFQSRRYDGDSLTLRSVLASGRLGDIYYFESHYDRFRPVVRQRWREMPGPGSGIWYDLGSHLADEALQLVGMPQAIYADLATQRPGCETVDHFYVLLR
ncbi:MAG: Gfo/Idh/MocA family oxidoreductase, partial [Candidatus Binataceae bacterium]